MALAVVVGETLLLYPLGHVAEPVSLGVIYLLGVLLVSIVWGIALGIATSVASALAFNFFHIPPTGGFSIAEGENLVALIVFLIAAAVASSVAEAARRRAAEAVRAGREAGLAAELARVLLGATDLSAALGPAAQRIAHAHGLASCRLVLEAVGGDERTAAIPLARGDERLGTLLVPHDAEDAVAAVRPPLEALLAAGLARDTLTREVVETRALRRSDEIKTSVLRAVSHDLRSPLTGIVTAAAALASPALEDGEREELAAGITAESTRLGRLVDKLLELSRLEAGVAEPRRDWCAVEELLREAVTSAGVAAERVKLVVDRELPQIRADAAQLERAFANLIENAARHSGGESISVRARVSGGRLLVRVVDHGPGIPLAEQQRIFEPFVRGADGSGLRPGPGDRARLRRGQRRPRPRGVAAGPGRELRRRAAAGRAGARMTGRRRVLVCDDEPQILRALRVVLRDAGFDVVPAATAQEALDLAAVQPPDAAILDLVLPDGSGIEICRALREWTRMPILLLSAVGDEDEKVRALEAGADDYVVKPFAPRELVARLQAVLRRAGEGQAEPAIVADGLVIDLAARTVTRDGAEVHLTPIEYGLLRALARQRGRLMTHRALLVEVWGPAYAEDTQVLRTHIANLRRKIEPPDAPPRYIRTDAGVGYRFAA